MVKSPQKLQYPLICFPQLRSSYHMDQSLLLHLVHLSSLSHSHLFCMCYTIKIPPTDLAGKFVFCADTTNSGKLTQTCHTRPTQAQLQSNEGLPSMPFLMHALCSNFKELENEPKEKIKTFGPIPFIFCTCY